MARLAIFALFFVSVLCAQPKALDIQSLAQYPKGNAKNFYIWSLMQETQNSSILTNLLSQYHNIDWRIYKVYLQQSSNALDKEIYRCINLKPHALLTQKKSACTTLGITPYKVGQLSNHQRERLFVKIKQNPYFKWITQMHHANDAAYMQNHPKLFMKLFFEAGARYKDVLNHAYEPHFYDTLSQLKEFERFVEYVTVSQGLHRLKKGLLYFEPKHTLSTHTHFYLALNKIRHHHYQRALNDLKIVAQKDYLQSNRDKALFWMYRLTKERILLEKLYKSHDINIYSIYAAQKLKKPLIGVYVPRFKDSVRTNIHEDDPFAWSAFVQNIKNQTTQAICQKAYEFDALSTQSSFAFLLERCSKYTLHPYIMPYEDFLKHASAEDKALIYAIGRQESRFVSGGLSSAFAQGVMQIMPFLSKHIAKQKKESITPLSMFDAQKNIAYAMHHLKFLKARLDNVLFIAYAYNGGIGFTKRELQKGRFSMKHKHQPFLGMELITYAETREYGKKVLANYVVYKQLLNQEVNLEEVFQTLN